MIEVTNTLFRVQGGCCSCFSCCCCCCKKKKGDDDDQGSGQGAADGGAGSASGSGAEDEYYDEEYGDEYGEEYGDEEYEYYDGEYYDDYTETYTYEGDEGTQEAASVGGGGGGGSMAQSGIRSYAPCPEGYCMACKTEITGESFMAGGNAFHSECFNCVQCGAFLGGENTRHNIDVQGRVECVPCHQRAKALDCYKCYNPIIPEAGASKVHVVRAMGKTYHQTCFTCAVSTTH